MRSLIPPTALLLLLALPAAAGGTTWYVDLANTPPGTGTESDPYTSIQYAVSQPSTVNGDTILVAKGTYAENVDFLWKQVTVVSAAGPHATHVVPAVPTESIFRRGGGWNCIVRGLTVRDSVVEPAFKIFFKEGIRVQRCIVRDNLLAFDNGYDVWIENCNVVDNDYGVLHYGGVHPPLSITTVLSSILWNNGANFIGDVLDCRNGWLCVYDSVLGDPLFFGPDDHHIQAGSPCINAGTAGETDPDGSPLDVGVYPYDPNYPLGTSYCTPTANSSGGRAVMAISGSASLSANDLVLAVTRTPANSSGLFFLGTAQVEFPLGDGVVCAGGLIGRLPLTPTGPFGVPQYAFDTADVPSHVPPIQPGEGRGFQYWFRDPTGGPVGWNYSNAAWVVFGP